MVIFSANGGSLYELDLPVLYIASECSKKGFTITKKILMSSKMSGFEVLAFKSIPHGRGGVIMIENDYA